MKVPVFSYKGIVLFIRVQSTNNKASFSRDDDHKMIVKVKLCKPHFFPFILPPND